MVTPEGTTIYNKITKTFFFVNKECPCYFIIKTDKYRIVARRPITRKAFR